VSTPAHWANPPAVATTYDLWTDDHEALRTQVRNWVAEHLAPNVDEWEKTGNFPRELFEVAGQAGLFGWKIPGTAGGRGPDFLADAVIAQELASGWSGGVAAALGAHKDLGPYYIWRFGTDEQRARWMPAFLTGTRIGALGVTEPGAGSDVAGLRTRAVRDGDDWLLSGSKTFITNGDWADVLVIAAVTDPDAGGHHGMTLFVVERGDPGFTSRRIETLGWRTSSTGELSFEEVRLPADRLLGGEVMLGQGFVAIMHNFQWERIGMALGAVRHAEDVLHVAGDAVSRDLAAEVAAAAALADRALRGYVNGQDMVRETSMAKWYACDVSVRVGEAALAAGGWPALLESRLERSLRDARLGPIGGGTTEIMKEVVGRGYGL
jgi:acyl-CoA dehydrogenase